MEKKSSIADRALHNRPESCLILLPFNDLQHDNDNTTDCFLEGLAAKSKKMKIFLSAF